MSERVLRIHCLPAGHGDSILVEYGGPAHLARILIDGGPVSSYAAVREALTAASGAERCFELLVVSHIDADHIDGVLMLLQDRDLGMCFGDVWFNGWPQVAAAPRRDVFAAEQGEFLGALLHAQKQPWNATFDGRSAAIPGAGPLPVVTLPGGALLTLLSPGDNELRSLREEWRQALADAGAQPGDWRAAQERLALRTAYQPRAPRSDVFAAKRFGSDRSVANGASIAFIIEYAGRRVLLGADAHAGVLTTALRRLAAQQAVQRVRLDAVKLPHHGSMANIDQDFLDAIDSSCFLVSTNGDYFRHPDAAAIRLIGERVPGAEVRFNQRGVTTEAWADEGVQQAAGIRAVHPPHGAVLELRE